MSTNKRLTQAQINDQISEKCGLKKSVVKELFEALNGLAVAEVNTKGEFTVPGFGKLVKLVSKERKGRNPATGATITIPSKTTVKLRLGKSIKESVA